MLKYLLLCSVLLAGCAAPQKLEGNGVRVDTPVGYSIGCLTNPDSVLCPKDHK